MSDGTAPPATAALTFVGTATTVIELGAFTVLTDPNFLHRGQRAYLGKGLWSRRLTEPAFGVDELPPLDAVLLSHLHGDHFDRVARRGLTRDAPVLTTPAAARRLGRWGFTTQGLRDWDSVLLERGSDTLTVHAVPGRHGRGLVAPLLPPVIGTVLEHRVQGRLVRRVYVTGDTLPGPWLDPLTERLGTPDVAVVHLGGTRILFHTVTMDAELGVDLLEQVLPRQVVPVHHSDYPVFRSPLGDFLLAASRAGHDTVRPVEPGQRLDLTTVPSAPTPP